MPYEVLTTVDRVKTWLEVPPDQTTDDVLLQQLVQSVSVLIGKACGRDNLGSIETYTEYYDPPRGSLSSRPLIVLNNYPVLSITSMTIGGVAIAQVTDPSAGTQSGLYLQADGRTLSWRSMNWLTNWSPGWPPYGLPLKITYTAGYDPTALDEGLIQAATQAVALIYRSKKRIGYKSQALAGETTSYFDGAKMGLDPTTVAFLTPYKNKLPRFGLN